MYNNYEERIELLNNQLVTEYKKNVELEKRIKEALKYIEETIEDEEQECFVFEDYRDSEEGIKRYFIDSNKILKILKGETND